MSHSFPRLSLALHYNLLDFRVGRRYQKLGAEEANAAQDFDGFGQESGVKHWLGQVQVSEVTGAFVHVAGTGQTTRRSVDDALAWVHQAADLGTAALVDFGKANTSLGHGHPADLVRTQDAELHPLDLPDRSLGVTRVNSRHVSSYGGGLTTRNQVSRVGPRVDGVVSPTGLRRSRLLSVIFTFFDKTVSIATTSCVK